MRISLFIALCVVSMSIFADARFVEAPAECHFPWDNNNVDNEYKIQACDGVLYQGNGGGVVSVSASSKRDNVPVSFTVVNGLDIRDVDQYPGGVLTIQTTGDDSGTNCNVVDAGGTAYTTNNWTANTIVSRRSEVHHVDVTFDLTCWGAVAQ